MKNFIQTRLHDRRVLSPANFSVYDKFRSITRKEPYGLALAWSYCAGTPHYSIVLSQGEGLVAKIIGAESVDEACKNLREQLDAAFEAEKRPDRKVNATVNFSPNRIEAGEIAGIGADLLFIPELFNRDVDKEAEMVRYWLGHELEQDADTKRNGMDERALILVRPKRIG